MKHVVFFLIALKISSALAGENNFEMSKKGLYVGTLDDGHPCSIEVLEMEKTLITRRLKSIRAEISVSDFQKVIPLGCEYDSENGGTICLSKTASLSIMLSPKIGWHADSYPDFVFTLRGNTGMCKDLRLVQEN